MTTGIYKITNKINGKSYIGQSVCIERRWKEHLNRHSKSLIHKAIEKYGEQNFDFSIVEECCQEDLDEKEQYWIKYYNTFNDGYNLTRGGNSGFFYDIEAVYEDFLRTGNIHKTAENIGCHTTTARNILRIFDINLTEYQKDKPVEQIDPITLKVVKIYDTIQDAADAVHVNRSGISGALSGHKKSAGGYYWREVGSSKVFQSKKLKQWKRKINQYDLNDNFIFQHNSIADALRSLGKNPKQATYIIKVCKGEKESVYGYKWKYSADAIAEDEE